MAAKQITQLVKMADQIALNLGAGHDPAAADRTAEHIKRFWAPAMIRQLVVFWREGGEVAPVVAAALAKLDSKAREH
ncbi:MAG: formate dehydrogenase subunit delta [Halioglobus sp.]